LALTALHCEVGVATWGPKERAVSTSEELSPSSNLTQVWRTDFTSLNATSGGPGGAYDWVFELFEPNGEVEQYTTNVCNGNSNPVGTNWNYCIQSGQGGGSTDGYALQIRAQNDSGTIHSGRLNSKRMHEFVPGANQGLQYEANIKFDANSVNSGSWPAFWMLQRNIQEYPVMNDGDTAPWPCNGAQEVDIMEMGSLGGTWTNRYNQSSLHYDSGGCSPQNPNTNPSQNNNWASQLDDGNYHKFAMEFECGSSCAASSTMRFFVDGVQEGSDINTSGAGFDSVASFFILDYAVGGGLGGTVNYAAFNNPGRSMYIDYIKVASYNPSNRGGSSTGSFGNGGVPWAVPGAIQAENYDTFGANRSYYDTTPGNSGGQDRSDDVDIEVTTDTGAGYDVGWIIAGEWLNYSTTVANAGTYNVQVRVAAQSASTMHVNVDGTNVTGSLAIPNTGGWQNWTTVTSPNFSLTAGTHTVQAFFDSGGNNFNWMAFSSVASSCTTTSCSAQGKNCGSIGDGCGGTLNCGSCTSPQTCGGGGTANVCGGGSSGGGGGSCASAYSQSNCLSYAQGTVVSSGGHNWTCSNGNCANCSGYSSCAPGGSGCPWGAVWTDDGACGGGSCTPTTCSAQGKNCGSIGDGCGGTLNCGSCSSSQTCGGSGTANVCGCTPTTCSAQGKNCGSISDGCGGTLNCGSCSSSQTCGGGGMANVCGGSSSSSSSGGSSSSSGGGTCAGAYSQSNCLTFTQGTVVSSGGHNWLCSNGNCANCASYSTCAPGGSGCPWGVVWSDQGACQ
jgi:hypothetical protein